MKNKIFLIALLLTGLFIGCEEDEYDAPNSFSDVGWYTSLLTQVPLQININNNVSFSDLSQGTLEHSWTIEEGNFFLNGPLPKKDSTTVYEDYIATPIKTESLDKTVHVLFKNSGLQKVRLYNTFKDSVSFKGKQGLVDIILPSVKMGDKWVIDTTFVVDVFDTIVPQMLIKQNGVVIPHENPNDTIYVEAGDFLEFTDLTTIGRPNTRFWNIGGNTASDSISKIVFKKLGATKGIFASSRTGQNIPGDYEQYKIPVNFKVVPSSKPFEVYGSLKELENETIQIPFNGEFAPFQNQEQYFDVKVNGTSFPITSIEINAADATILDVKLAGKIYRPDVITISYAGGTLQSTDTRSPVAFTNLPVKMHDVNLWDNTIYGFENGVAGWIKANDGAAGTVEYVTEHPATGNYCLKLTNPTGGAWTKASGENVPVVLTGGKTYTVSYKVWIDPSTTAGSFGPWLFWAGGGQQFWTSFNGLARGEWITFTRDQAVPTTGPVYFTLRVNAGAIMYLDDVRIVETEKRP